MRTSLILALLLCAQDGGKRLVEGPVKELISLEPEKFDLTRTGISWVKGLEAATGRGKPILLFQLLGNFDDVYC